MVLSKLMKEDCRKVRKILHSFYKVLPDKIICRKTFNKQLRFQNYFINRQIRRQSLH